MYFVQRYPAEILFNREKILANIIYAYYILINIHTFIYTYTHACEIPYVPIIKQLFMCVF